jgi:hypothetical protein
MIRVMFKARDNGQEFPVYFSTEEEIPEAAEKLGADIVSQAPATETDMVFEQFAILTRRSPRPEAP